MHTLQCKRDRIFCDRQQFLMAMSAISKLSKEVLGPISKETYPMFLSTEDAVFNVFATDEYVPRVLPRPKMCCHDEICDIIADEAISVPAKLASLHISVWGSEQYLEPCLEPLKLITKVLAIQKPSNSGMNNVYVAGMGIAGLFASRQMMLSAVPNGNVREGYRQIKEFLEHYAKEKKHEKERLVMRELEAEKKTEQTRRDVGNEPDRLQNHSLGKPRSSSRLRQVHHPSV